MPHMPEQIVPERHKWLLSPESHPNRESRAMLPNSPDAPENLSENTSVLNRTLIKAIEKRMVECGKVLRNLGDRFVGEVKQIDFLVRQSRCTRAVMKRTRR